MLNQYFLEEMICIVIKRVFAMDNDLFSSGNPSKILSALRYRVTIMFAQKIIIQ